MKKKKLILSGVFASLTAVGLSLMNRLAVFAEDEACKLDVDHTNPACNSTEDLFGTFDSIVNAVLALVGAIAIIVIIVAGVMITSSAGDPGKVKKAKSAIVYALIGLGVALAAWGIVNFALNSL